MVVDAVTFAHMGATLPTNGNDSAAEKAASLAGIRVTPHTSTGTNYRDAIVAKMAAAPNAVMALFGGGIRVLEDPYTRAQEGERRFYGVLYGDFSVLRADAFDRHRFRVSVGARHADGGRMRNRHALDCGRGVTGRCGPEPD